MQSPNSTKRKRGGAYRGLDEGRAIRRRSYNVRAPDEGGRCTGVTKKVSKAGLNGGGMAGCESCGIGVVVLDVLTLGCEDVRWMFSDNVGAGLNVGADLEVMIIC